MKHDNNGQFTFRQLTSMWIRYGWLKLTGRIPKGTVGDRKRFDSPADSAATLGNIRWKVLDHIQNSESEIVETVPMLAKSSIEWLETKGKSILQSRKVMLDEEWSLILCYTCGQCRSGFSVNPNQSGHHDFAWEWFYLEPSGEAVKLQEAGRLALKIITTSDGEDIATIEFLTDVSLRISSTEHLSKNPTLNTQSPERRVLVLAGSTITFPLVIDGTVQVPS